MNVIDTIRIENLVQQYDFWLELRGAHRRQRKDLRRELRANVRAAAADIGTSRALANLGTPKQLAYEATEGEFERRPLWSRAAMYASLALGVILTAVMYTAAAFTAGVGAAGVTGQEVTGSVFPWWGVEFMARIEEDRGGLAVGASDIGWYILLIPLLVFLITARPWRLVTGRRAGTRENEPAY